MRTPGSTRQVFDCNSNQILIIIFKIAIKSYIKKVVFSNMVEGKYLETQRPGREGHPTEADSFSGETQPTHDSPVGKELEKSES